MHHPWSERATRPAYACVRTLSVAPTTSRHPSPPHALELGVGIFELGRGREQFERFTQRGEGRTRVPDLQQVRRHALLLACIDTTGHARTRKETTAIVLVEERGLLRGAATETRNSRRRPACRAGGRPSPGGARCRSTRTRTCAYPAT